MPLSNEQIEQYKKKLLLMKKQILEKIVDLQEEAQQEGAKGYSQHNADEASDDCDQNIALLLSEEEQNILHKIDGALAKIAEGSYGICTLSGKEIPKSRLDAIPYATTTIQAQEELEKRKEA